MTAAYLEGVADAWFKNWSHKRVELRWPQFVIDLCTQFREKTKTDVIKGDSKAAHQVVQEADEVAVEEEDGVHVADEKYEANEVLRMGMVATKNKEQSKLNQVIQNDKKEKAIVAEEIKEDELEGDVQSVDNLSSTLTGIETPDVIDLRKQQRKEPEKPLYQVLEEEEERIARATLFGTSHMNVIGTGTQNKTTSAKRVDLLKKKFEFLPMTGNEMVTGMTAPW